MFERLGPYQVVQRIGRGGMGVVYEGLDPESSEPVALKLLSTDLADVPGFRERFESEIDALRKLNHPNIVRLLGFGEQDGYLFYAMELVAGSSLEDQIRRGRTYDWREVTQLAVETCRALRHAHDRGIIHRDIKPGNLLLTTEGHVKLSDFGIARLFGNLTSPGGGGVVGTAEFMAPEQAEGRPVDPRTDLYSLGAVLYVLLARRPLFRGESFAEILQKQRFERPEPLSRYAPDAPAELESIIHQLLEKNADSRISNAGLLMRRLEAMEHALSHGMRLVEEVEEEPVHGSDVASDASPPDAAAPQGLATTRATCDVAQAGEAMQVPDGELPQTQPGTLIERPSEPGAAKVARYVPVTPGDLDDRRLRSSPTVWISPQTGALVLTIAFAGLAAWYALQPPGADGLYDRIDKRTHDGSSDALLQAEDDIREFLMRFPGDPRAEDLRRHTREIELLRTERKLELRAKGLTSGGNLTPIERLYVEALNYSWLSPDLGRARFQAIVDLYGARGERADPTAQCVELARRRLAYIDGQLDAQSQEHLPMLEERVKLAQRLVAGDPSKAKAKAMLHAVVELYRDKPWAAGAVRQAEAELRRLDAALPRQPPTSSKRPAEDGRP